MKKITFTLLLGCCLFLSSIRAQSDLFIDTTYTAEQMVMDFFDNSMITPSNVTFNGGSASLAFFEAADTDLGIPAGIFICTGNVHDAANSYDFFAATANNAPGDPDLEALLGGQYVSYDASVLEFDILVNTDTAAFTYVFGSEEYPEYVNSSFNDVFAFYMTDASSNMTNIALVPNDQMPVAINNVHSGLNSNYYVDNQGLMGQHIAYDGFTTPLPATYVATSGNSYHVKIAVTDMGDQVFDSGVFISIGSLGGSDTLQPPADAQVAVNGNSVSVDNLSRYATSWFWDFGDGYTTTERYPGPHTYAADGEYTITLTTQNFCCTDTYTTVVQIGEVNNTTELAAIPFELFPNPATDQLTIQAPLDELFQYEITDISGRSFKLGTCQGTETIGLSGLTPGVYHIRVTGEAGTAVKRFLIEE
ncbi:MAG: choice-of-anchor L domain-containing protein [Phaeodactylibacter sp.]|nr:choice-of-anchor L domain-containing protein [Phaeodactylibacter sp.]